MLEAKYRAVIPQPHYFDLVFSLFHPTLRDLLVDALIGGSRAFAFLRFPSSTATPSHHFVGYNVVVAHHFCLSDLIGLTDLPNAFVVLLEHSRFYKEKSS